MFCVDVVRNSFVYMKILLISISISIELQFKVMFTTEFISIVINFKC